MPLHFEIKAKKAKTNRNLRWATKMSLVLAIEVESARVQTEPMLNAGCETDFQQVLEFVVESIDCIITFKLLDYDQGKLYLVGSSSLPLRVIFCNQARTIALAYNGQAIGFVAIQCSCSTVINQETEFVINHLSVLQQPDEFTKQVVRNLSQAFEIDHQMKVLLYDLSSSILPQQESRRAQQQMEQRRRSEMQMLEQGKQNIPGNSPWVIQQPWEFDSKVQDVTSLQPNGAWIMDT